MTSDGTKLDGKGLAKYLSGLRRIGISAEFNGEMCRGLLAVRFDLETPLKSRRRTQTPLLDERRIADMALTDASTSDPPAGPPT